MSKRKETRKERKGHGNREETEDVLWDVEKETKKVKYLGT